MIYETQMRNLNDKIDNTFITYEFFVRINHEFLI